MRFILANTRKQEALWLFEPTPTQEAFLASNADERLAIGGNLGGMTTTTMVEIARAVTSLRLASFFSLAMASTCCSVSPTEYNFSSSSSVNFLTSWVRRRAVLLLAPICSASQFVNPLPFSALALLSAVSAVA